MKLGSKSVGVNVPEVRSPTMLRKKEGTNAPNGMSRINERDCPNQGKI